MISHKNLRFFKILERYIAKIEGIKMQADEVDHDHCVKVHDKLHEQEVESSNVIFNDH